MLAQSSQYNVALEIRALVEVNWPLRETERPILIVPTTGIEKMSAVASGTHATSRRTKRRSIGEGVRAGIREPNGAACKYEKRQFLSKNFW